MSKIAIAIATGYPARIEMLSDLRIRDSPRDRDRDRDSDSDSVNALGWEKQM